MSVTWWQIALVVAGGLIVWQILRMLAAVAAVLVVGVALMLAFGHGASLPDIPTPKVSTSDDGGKLSIRFGDDDKRTERHRNGKTKSDGRRGQRQHAHAKRDERHGGRR